MDLVSFHERIYGKYEGQLFTFEPTWDSFRPITSVGWDGKQLVPIDVSYKSDLFSDVYGYGSTEMKSLCRKLAQETELEDAKEIKEPIQLWRWYNEKNLTWWKDRPCVFMNPCVSRDGVSWKKYLTYLEVRAKTLKQRPHMRATKRLLPK